MVNFPTGEIGKPQGLFTSDTSPSTRTNRSGTIFSTDFDSPVTAQTKILSEHMNVTPASSEKVSKTAKFLNALPQGLQKIIQKVVNLARSVLTKSENNNPSPVKAAPTQAPKEAPAKPVKYDLAEIRSNPELKAKFYEFAQSRKCEENLDFLDLLDNKELLASNPRAFLDEILKKIDLNGEAPVNISDELRSETEELSDNWDASKLKDLIPLMHEEISTMVSNDTLREYKP
jgi:hypothetical protein